MTAPMTSREELLTDEVTLADFIYSIRSYGDAVAKAKLLWPMLSVAQAPTYPWKGNLSADLRKGALSVRADGLTLIDGAGVCWAVIFPDKTGSYDHASAIVAALALPSTESGRVVFTESDWPERDQELAAWFNALTTKPNEADWDALMAALSTSPSTVLPAPAPHAEVHAMLANAIRSGELELVFCHPTGKFPALSASQEQRNIVEAALRSPAPHAEVREALGEQQIDILAKRVAGAELNYRNSYEKNGGDHIETGRNWDLMRRSGDAIRQHFYEREEAPQQDRAGK